MSSQSGSENQPSVAEVKNTFDVPVRMRVRGDAQVYQAMLLHIALSGCRIQSTLQLERGTALSFEWRLSSGKLLQVAGVIAARYAARSGGPGYEYALALEPLPQEESEEFEKEAAFLVRSASARSYDTSVVDISQFINYRVPDDVTVSYRLDEPRRFGIGSASDVTGNALRLRCTEALRANDSLHLAVRLPDVVLNVHKGRDDELVSAPLGAGHVPRKVLRRPFQEIQLSGRVTGVVKDSKRREAYEIELLNLDPVARQEIARYIHASQLARVKRS